MAVAAVERLEVPHVGGERRPEGVVVDGPAGLVLGVAVAVFLDQAVEELEQVARGPQVAERVLQVVVADRVIDEAAEPGAVGPGAVPSPTGWPLAEGVIRQAFSRSLARS